MKSILIVTPFRNEEHSIPHYLKALKALDYPFELVDVYWLENDSSDNTLEMLKDAKNDMPFKSTVLETINILGSQKKRAAGSYFKDLPTGPNRKITWPVIWNKHFLPLIKKSRVDYVLVWYADAVAPPNIITEYLKVFSEYGDAGWVGGAMHRRKGYSSLRRGKAVMPLAFPLPLSLVGSKKVVRVSYTGHCWMCPRQPLSKTEFYNHRGHDMHLSLIKGLSEQGLSVYYQPTVYLKHISTDGKIYRHELGKT